MEKFKEHLLDNIISFAFILLGSELLFYSIYTDFNMICSLSILILVFVYFYIFKKVVDLKRKGILLYLIAGIISIGITYIVVNITTYSVNETFYQWAFGGGAKIGQYLGYIVGGVIFITFVFSSLSYYFTINLVRMPMVFLLSIIVIVSYIKGVYIQRSLISSIGIFLFIYVTFSLFSQGTKVKYMPRRGKLHVNRWHVLKVTLAFSGAMFMVAYFLPIPYKLPQSDFLDTVRKITNSYMGTSNLNGFNVKENSIREINQSTKRNSDEIVYRVEGEDIRYLIDHSFDKFENGVWKYGTEDFKTGELVLSSNRTSYIDDGLYYLNRIDKNNEEYGHLIKERDEKFYRTLTIGKNDDDSNFLSHPPNTLSANISSLYNERKNIYLNPFDQLFTGNNGDFKNGEVYEIEYINDEPSDGSLEEALMKFMNIDRFNGLIEEAGLNGNAEYSIYVGEIFLEINKDVTDRMKELAMELTKDKESLYDKASSIEEHFLSGEYIYNLDLPINRDKTSYIDYFIFQGKEGYCVQYATAMTLLCRASGMPARYVEGYLVSEKDESGNYIVRESDGHAFVQVFIPGYGWKIFDPTPPSNEEEVDNSTKTTDNDSGGGISNIRESFTIFLLVILAIAIITMLIYLLLYITRRKRFLLKVRRKSKEEYFEALLKDSIILLEKEDIEPYEGETEIEFASRVDRELNLGFLKLMETYYGYKYAFNKLSKDDVQEALRVNREIYEYIKGK